MNLKDETNKQSDNTLFIALQQRTGHQSYIHCVNWWNYCTNSLAGCGQYYNGSMYCPLHLLVFIFGWVDLGAPVSENIRGLMDASNA